MADLLSQETLQQSIEQTVPVDEPKPTENESLCGHVGFSWFKDLYESRNEVWHKIKEDFTEVACVATTESKQVIQKSATSLSNVINEKDVSNAIDVNSLMHHLGAGINSLSSLGNNYLKTYLLPPTQDDTGEEVLQLDSSLGETDTSAASLEVKIQILRADPSTYLVIPRPLEGICSYEDWFNAYFDENTCQPRPGVPLPIDNSPAAALMHEAKLAPKHATPAEILEKCPAVKMHLRKLVNPELGLRRSDNIAKEGLSEVDFWSRYYYRVWCLETLEARRLQLAAKVASTSESVALLSLKNSEASGSNKSKTRWDSTSSEEEAQEASEQRADTAVSSKPTQDEGTEQGTPEILTMKSESPVHLSDDGIREDSTDPDENGRPLLKTSDTLTKNNETESVEEDDWENWS